MSETGEDAPHKVLVKLADRWLCAQSFGVVIRDCFRAYVDTGEQPDVIGWRSGASCLIECKVSRADFLSDRKKAFRTKGGMGDWRFFLCPPDVIKVEDLPAGWGLLWATGKRVLKISGFPPNTAWRSAPFNGNKLAENQMLVSALRRYAVRGQFDVIYDGLYEGPPSCDVVKPYSEFYPHKVGLGGRRSRCTICERAACNTDHRRATMKKWRATAAPHIHERAMARSYDHVKRHRAKYPEKARAVRKVRHEMESGRLVAPALCEDCGIMPKPRRDGRRGLHAHHEDYSLPLAVNWLCAECHVRRHSAALKGNGEGQ